MLKNIKHKEIENLCIKCRESLAENNEGCPFLSFDNEPCPELVLASEVFETLTMAIEKKYKNLKRR